MDPNQEKQMLEIYSSETEIYGINVKALHPGTTLPEKILREIHKNVGTNMTYEFWLWRVKDYIQEELYNLGRPRVVAQKDWGLRVLLDNEMSEYLRVHFDRCVAQLASKQEQMTWVKRSKLSEDEKTRYDKSQYQINQQVGAIDKKRRELGLLEARQLLTKQVREISS